jgi:hypothetical protein
VDGKAAYRQAQMGICGNMHEFLQQYHEEGEAFLQCTITGDEKRVHHYEPASECKNME